MKLAEALLERADLQKRIESLQARIVANASYQEGEQPTEDAAELLDECATRLLQLERLVTSINITNATAPTDDGRTITALLAARETLRSQHSILVRAADAAAGSWGQRQMRSELRQMSALPVRDVRAKADGVAQALRQLDVVIQRTNWEVELLEA
ncbi:DIP1984 family protein [Pseudoclavibacter terrae]|uniref:DIP1984 family protein n=1 Tax=Pseudoclavibacter terrae TaxID=1530195 RepID=UPI002330028D|nr:DIP1984 family protein [Pseudoclavibacter terrae]